MTDRISPALTPEEWAKGGHRREFGPDIFDRPEDLENPHCVKSFQPGTVRVSCGDCVTWGHGAVLDAEDRHAAAALCLYGQPFGFTREDVEALQFEGNDLLAWAGDAETDDERRRMNRHGFQLLNVASRIAALLPPETP